jgi:methylated-DNA-[protein]-cysteine S-methyltransferase
MKFSDNVYALCRRIPKGKVSTYREIGNAIGGSGMVYRAVGVALKRNPYAPAVPCHRVVAADGRIGGFHGRTKGAWIAKKIRLLKAECVKVKNRKVVDFDKKLHKF